MTTEGLGQVELRTRPFRTIHEVKVAVARRWGVSLDDLASRSKARKLSTPRQIAMALAYRRLRPLGVSFAMIGRSFGGRDHSTVYFAARKYGHKPMTYFQKPLPPRQIGAGIALEDCIAGVVRARVEGMGCGS